MHKSFFVISLALFAAVVFAQPSEAQEREGWPHPVRLSSSEGDASEASMVSDQYGFLHVFWSESRDNDRTVLQYARFNGLTWSAIIDIHTTREFSPIQNISVSIDQNGILHLVWVEGLNGTVFYTSAPAYNALSAQFWVAPRRLYFTADILILQIDSQNIFHILYTKTVGKDPGVHYFRSEDLGESWSEPVWLDPDILPGFIPAWVRFELDEAGGLHAVWYYLTINASGGDWVRYAHSLDGGTNWSQPFTIDKIDEDNPDKQLNAANPVMAVAGQSVHIIWAGGKLHYRNYRFSEDSGQTWSVPTRVFGDLNGQAGDGMAVDGAGRVHYFGQIRYPQGVYHAVLEDKRWINLNLVYLVTYGSGDLIGDRIHSHRTFPAILNGNQLILTFTDPPPEDGRRLFVMTYTMDDILPTTIQPTPSPTPKIVPSPTPNGMMESTDSETTAEQLGRIGDLSLNDIPRPDTAVWVGVIPTLLFVGVFLLIRVFIKLRN